MSIIFDVATITKQGGRDYNQDYLGYKLGKNGGCFIVCDGLGAYKGSEDASRIAVETMLGFFRAEKNDIDAETIKKNIDKTHDKILDYKKKHPEIRSSCTTLSCVLIEGTDIAVSHIGDTRSYYFKDNKIVSYTIDHSVSQWAVETGEITREQIRFHEDRNKLLRVLGGERTPNPDVRENKGVLSSGDRFLICTDGFWEYVTEEEMEEDLAAAKDAGEWVNLMEQRVLKRAPKYNDNYSAIAVLVGEEE